MNVEIKSYFGYSIETTQVKALERAKKKFLAIMGKPENHQKKVDYINQQLIGIQFNLQDLYENHTG